MSTINTQALLDAVSELIQERESVLAGAVSELTARVAGLSAENAELRGRLDDNAAAVAEELKALRAAPVAPVEVKADDGHLEDWKDLVLGTVDATVDQFKADWQGHRDALKESIERAVKAEVEPLSARVLDANAGWIADVRAAEERLDTLERRIDEGAINEQVRDLEVTVDALRSEWPAFQASVTDLVKSESAILAKRTADEHQALDHQVTIIANRVGAAEGHLADAVKVDRVQDLEEVVKAVSRDTQTLKLAIEGGVERRDELSDELAKTVAKVDTIHSHFDATLKTVDALRVRVGEAVDAIDQAPSEVLSMLLERQGEVEDWKRGGAGYRALATVRHGGALWQARIDTKTEPGTGESWVMLADGASGVSVSCDDEGNVVFTTRLASGVETSTTYKMPHVNATGVFEDGRAYRRYDTVVQDGNVFWALVDDPGKIGETKGNWLCLGYRGKAGKRGPTIEEVASSLRPQLVRELTSELPGLVSVAVEALQDR